MCIGTRHTRHNRDDRFEFADGHIGVLSDIKYPANHQGRLFAFGGTPKGNQYRAPNPCLRLVKSQYCAITTMQLTWRIVKQTIHRDSHRYITGDAQNPCHDLAKPLQVNFKFKGHIIDFIQYLILPTKTVDKYVGKPCKTSFKPNKIRRYNRMTNYYTFVKTN